MFRHCDSFINFYIARLFAFSVYILHFFLSFTVTLIFYIIICFHYVCCRQFVFHQKSSRCFLFFSPERRLSLHIVQDPPKFVGPSDDFVLSILNVLLTVIIDSLLHFRSHSLIIFTCHSYLIRSLPIDSLAFLPICFLISSFFANNLRVLK